MPETIARTVQATGVVVTKFDRVNITVTTRARHDSSVEAKAAVEPRVTLIQEALTALEGEGVLFVEGRTRTGFKVSQNFNYDRHTGDRSPAGYTAIYTVHFQTENVDRVGLILNRLTALENIEVGEPQFRIDDVEQHNKTAFEDAFNRALARFNDECAILGKDPNRYVITSWNVHYEDHLSAGAKAYGSPRAAMAVESVADGGGGIEIEAGDAVIKAHGTFSFSW